MTTETNEITVPKTCKECPVVRVCKDLIFCGCMRSLSANKQREKECRLMRKKCPIGWNE